MDKGKAKKDTENPSGATKRGPKPETVKIEENWEKAVKKSLKKKKPKDGWPK